MTESGIPGASGGALPNAVRIVEVGPRDGLQNERAVVPLAAKLS
jgi:hydroxymethylglutaryl-CoA lyase